MNKTSFSTLLMLFLSLQLLAQPGNGDKKEKIAAAKIAFITKELNLTPQEAQVFWPVYNQFQNETEELNKKRKSELMNAKNNIDAMSDADVAKVIDNEFGYQQQELDVRKKYNEEFKKVLPVKKVAKFWVAEQKFKLFLLKQLKEQAPPGR